MTTCLGEWKSGGKRIICDKTPIHREQQEKDTEQQNGNNSPADLFSELRKEKKGNKLISFCLSPIITSGGNREPVGCRKVAVPARENLK